MSFELLNAFKGKKHIIDLELSKVILEDKIYPWILLIPMRENITQINQLNEKDSLQLIKEINFASNIMEKLFPTERLNVAAIGNKTPQLHIHIISRNTADPLWPETIWGQKMEKLTPESLNERADLLKTEFSQAIR